MTSQCYNVFLAMSTFSPKVSFFLRGGCSTGIHSDMSFLFGTKQPEFEQQKLKANLRMSITRIQQQKSKRTNAIRILRRQLAELMNASKVDEARVKVEGLIRDTAMLQALDILILFIELVTARLQVLAESKSCPPEMKEALTSILWAVPRIDGVPEFHAIRLQCALKFGKAFCEMAAENGELSVNEKLVEKMSIQVPLPTTCVEYMEEIAAEYGVTFDAERLKREDALIPDGRSLVGDAAAVAAGGTASSATKFVVPPIIVPKDELEARLLALKLQ